MGRAAASVLARYKQPDTSLVGETMKDDMALFPTVITRNSRGLLRVWLLLSLVWAAYASTIVTWPWQLEKQLVASEIYPADDSIRPILNEHDARIKSICQSGSILMVRESFPQMRATGQRLGFDGQMALQRVESSGQRVSVRTIPDPETAMRAKVLNQQLGLDGAVEAGSSILMVKEWIFPATRQVSAFCFPIGAKTQAMVKALAISLAIPIGVAIAVLTAIAILCAIWRWLADGFRDSQPTIARSDVSIQVADARRPGVPSGTIPASDRLTKPLLWSVVIATVADIFARGTLGHERATGTNMFIFGTIALLIYMTIAGLGNRVSNERRRNIALGSFWASALIVVSITMARYL